MALPVSTKFCTVTGRFLRAIADGADANNDPDGIPVAGLHVVFTPVLTPSVVTNALEKTTVAIDPVLCTTDVDGYLIGENWDRDVRLVASNDPSLSPAVWTWRVEVSGPEFPRISFTFVAPADGVIDLASVVPVPSNPGAQAGPWQAAVDAVVTVRDEVFVARDGVVAAIDAFDPNQVDVDGAVATYMAEHPVKGAKGDKGDTGDEGPRGYAGPQGERGPSGTADDDIALLVATPGTDSRAAVEGLIGQQSAVSLAPAPTGSDDTATLNAFFAGNVGRAVALRAGQTYQVSDTLNVPAGLMLNGNGAIFDARAVPVGTGLSQRFAMRATGTVNAAVTISTAIPQGSRVITDLTSTAGFSVGDLVRLTNDEQPVPGLVRVDRDKGELNIVRSVDSATQLTLTTATLFAYGTLSLRIAKVNPVENVTIRDLSVICGGVGSAHNGIQIKYGRNVLVENVVVRGGEDVGVSLSSVWNGKVSHCTITDSTSSATLGNSGYGVAIVDGSRHCLVESNHFRNCRHFVAGGGAWPVAYIDVNDNHGEVAIDAAYDVHESCFYWNYRRNTASGVANGFIIRGQHILVEGNIVRDSTGFAYKAATFDLVTEQRGIQFVNNIGVRCAYGLFVDGQAAGAEPNCLKINTRVVGNRLGDCGPNPIMVRHFDGAEVSGNVITSASGDGIAILGLAGTPSTGLLMTGNSVRDTTSNGIRVENVDGVTITGPSTTATGLHGISLKSCNRTNIVGPTVRTPAGSGIYVEGGAIHTITGALVSGGASAGYDAIRVTGSADVTIAGGYLASARYGVYSTTTDYVTITGVNARSAANATKLNVDATNKAVANNLV